MKVVRAKVLGFCMGVRRAVELTEKALLDSVSRGAPVYTLGPLIHNPQALLKLKQKNVKILSEEDILSRKNLPLNLDRSIVIIRAHGVSPGVEEELLRRGVRIIDATCKRVKISQMKAKELAGKGCRIFLAGEEKHAEIAGIKGYAELGSGGKEGACFVVDAPAEAEKAAAALFKNEPSASAALIGQTTITPEEYREIAESIKKYFPNLEIIDTICGATRERQESLRELCASADVLVIAGGKESANTRRLYDIACGLGKKTWLVENAGDLPAAKLSAENFAGLSDKISGEALAGLAAGASTPDDVIDSIEEALERL
ncbi:MAG: 4-hydroxy-3-methylbut-2-enyl diphosphate reductase [Treponema sp.]|nr:4-hydroxy-3-methylbut-2-enyl diphosphate reductase [Treponema sp.]